MKSMGRYGDGASDSFPLSECEALDGKRTGFCICSCSLKLLIICSVTCHNNDMLTYSTHFMKQSLENVQFKVLQQARSTHVPLYCYSVAVALHVPIRSARHVALCSLTFSFPAWEISLNQQILYFLVMRSMTELLICFPENNECANTLLL